MSLMEGRALAEFSSAVRESTLKRLRIVPEGFEGWRSDEDAMGFADLAGHLIDCDRWLFEKLESLDLETEPPRVSRVNLESRRRYLDLLEDLAETGKRREEILVALSKEQLSDLVFDKRFGGEVTVWWVVVRGNLDHEIHHRGQIAAYLRLILQEATSE